MMPTHHDLKCLTSSWLVTLPPLASMNWRTASSENSVGRPDMVAVVVRSKQTRRKLNLTEFLWTKKSHYGAKKLFLFHFLSKKIVWKTLNVRMEKKNWWFWRKMRFLIGFRFRILFGPLDSWMRQAHTGFLQQRKRIMKWKKARNILSATGF